MIVIYNFFSDHRIPVLITGGLMFVKWCRVFSGNDAATSTGWNTYRNSTEVSASPFTVLFPNPSVHHHPNIKINKRNIYFYTTIEIFVNSTGFEADPSSIPSLPWHWKPMLHFLSCPTFRACERVNVYFFGKKTTKTYKHKLCLTFLSLLISSRDHVLLLPEQHNGGFFFTVIFSTKRMDLFPPVFFWLINKISFKINEG